MEYRIDSLTVLCVDRDHIHPGDIYRVVLISRDPRLTPGKVRQIQRLYPFVGVAHRSYAEYAPCFSHAEKGISGWVPHRF